MHHVLAIETATANRLHPASVALKAGDTVSFHELSEPNSQAAQLVCAIESLLKAHSIWYQDVDQLIITVGPGSFTGIRIGLAVARSIAFACPKLQLLPITSFEALMAGYQGDCERLRAIMKAGKGELYSQLYEKNEGLWRAQDAIALCAPDAVPTDAPLYGNGLEGYEFELNARLLLQAPQSVAIAKREAVPLYVRAPDAKLPQKAGAL